MDGQVNILILEDNASDVELMKRELRRAGFDIVVQWAADKASFLQALDVSTPDIILADYSVPGFDGLTALATARKRFPQVPVVIVSGAIGEETAIETLKSGATDYVLKQRLGRLGPAVQRALREAQEQIERKRAERELAEARSDAENKAAQLESFISSMADGVALLDADGNPILVNDAGRAILGCPPDHNVRDWVFQCQWYPLEDAVSPLPLEEAAPAKALRGEVVRDARCRSVSPLGRETIVSVSASPVRDSQGGITGAVCIFRDVSDRVEFERVRQRLYQREHRIAETLQQTLIPSVFPYRTRCVSVAARYQPALLEAQVGGDFYDVFELGDDKLGVLIGDVAGKGLQAAIRVAAVRYSTRSYAYLDPSPGRVMGLVNEALGLEDPDIGNLLTAFFAVVDCADGTMTYACAGHEPPIICRAESSIEELAVTGMMLGVARGVVYGERSCELRPGDTVVMFTDGITEARREGFVLFDKAGVIEHVAKTCDSEPDEIAEGLLKAAVAHAGGSLHDDAAILVLRFLPDGLSSDGTNATDGAQ